MTEEWISCTTTVDTRTLSICIMKKNNFIYCHVLHLYTINMNKNKNIVVFIGVLNAKTYYISNTDRKYLYFYFDAKFGYEFLIPHTS